MLHKKENKMQFKFVLDILEDFFISGGFFRLNLLTRLRVITKSNEAMFGNSSMPVENAFAVTRYSESFEL